MDYGGRLSALFQINDDWNILLQQNHRTAGQRLLRELNLSPRTAPSSRLTRNSKRSLATSGMLAYRLDSQWENWGLGLVRRPAHGVRSVLVRHIDQQADYELRRR